MAHRKLPHSEDAEKLAEVLDEACFLLAEFSASSERAIAPSQNPASLLDQCLELCAQQKSVAPEPIRTLHHFACTGGTLLSKCVAALPNTQVLSEIDPLSKMQHKPEKPRFAPTDMVQLMRQSTRGATNELIIELFLKDLEVIYASTNQLGQRLVLRDHAHGQYCLGTEVEKRPDFRTIVSSKFPVLSLVTVRHPLDSYLSLKSNGWLHFSPQTLDEYCNRYIAFLENYVDVPIIRYEDFVASPSDTMRIICDRLNLPFSDQFIDLFGVFALTGDSGRSTTTIELKPRRPIDESLKQALDASEPYKRLANRLQYAD